MSKQVMTQALEALENWQETAIALSGSDNSCDPCIDLDDADKALIAALKEAIKQAGEIEDSLEAAYAAGQINVELAAFEQAGEPVAYRITTPDGITWIGTHPSILPKHTSEPLFTAAPSMQVEQAPCDIPEVWQPIETAPKDRSFIISDGENVSTGWWYEEGKVLGRWYPLDNPTHWMPLPAAPSE